jgi:hypothetical protein
MENKPLLVINYQSRTERLTFKEWWAMAPRRFTLLACIIGNLAVCIGVSLLIGGVAMGTTPSSQGYFVADHGHFVRVTERVWLFSLFYPAATLLMTPLAIGLLLASFNRGPFKGRMIRIALFASLWYVPWAYANIRDTSRSALDFWHLNSLWPGTFWLLGVSAVAILVVLLIASVRESRRERQRWISTWGERLNRVRPIVRRQ